MFEEKKYRVYVCGNIHCKANGSSALLTQLETLIWEQQLDSDVEVRVSGCQSRCDYGPNLTIWPGPFRYWRLTPDGIRRIVVQHLRDGQPVTELLSTL